MLPGAHAAMQVPPALYTSLSFVYCVFLPGIHAWNLTLRVQLRLSMELLPCLPCCVAADTFAITAVELEPGTTIPRGGTLMLTMSGTNQQEVTGGL